MIKKYFCIKFSKKKLKFSLNMNPKFTVTKIVCRMSYKIIYMKEEKLICFTDND